LQQRAFVLLPLLEISPRLQVPGLGDLTAYLPEVAEQAIKKLDVPW
jgi:2-amino-4-hydroxy-6-hydroxymethyldihydropteridine diphosphokinase